MTDFSEKLSNFIENVCPGHITDCESCPGGHYKDFGCVHPDHPSIADAPCAFITKEVTKEQFKKDYPSEQTAPFEHCPDCGTRSGGGRCGTCKDLTQNESARER